jgi:hypothetical protein
MLPNVDARNQVHDIRPKIVKECCLVRWWNGKKHKREITQWELDYVIHIRAKSSFNVKNPLS